MMNTTSRMRLTHTDSVGQYGTKFAKLSVCDLCESEKMCYDIYGFTSCEECQEDLLPSFGVRIY